MALNDLVPIIERISTIAGIMVTNNSVAFIYIP